MVAITDQPSTPGVCHLRRRAGTNSAELAAVAMLAIICSAASVAAKEEPLPGVTETELSEAGNSSNPVPSPDGKRIACVRLAWGREGGSGGYGVSNLITDALVLDSSGKLLTPKPLADAYLFGWTKDGTKLILFRDWDYFLVDVAGVKSERVRQTGDDSMVRSERCGYLMNSNEFIWARHIIKARERINNGETLEFSGTRIESGKRVLLETDIMLDHVVPSPDEQHVAGFRSVGMFGRIQMWVYNVAQKSRAEFGDIAIDPFGGWADSWDPWLPDGRLLIASGKEVAVHAPDGKDKKVIATLPARTGLPVLSPDQKRVAFLTWSGTAQESPGTTMYVMDFSEGAKPTAVTARYREFTRGLKWLDAATLVFDRYVPGERRQAPTSKLIKLALPRN
ncbi:MAG: hypothetical protein NTW87_05515 [Planctomycetota bacterium]|nr:hypothetical protein [Planctomycetota bacterium]